MSIGTTIFLTQPKLTTEEYWLFLNSCRSIFGNWSLLEVTPMNWRGDEVLHECLLSDEGTAHSEDTVRVWIDLYRRNFSKKFGRSRKQIFWVIYIETKAGRTFLDYAIQQWIPLKAFQYFKECIVEDDAERIFLEPKTYKELVKHELQVADSTRCLRLIELS